VKLKGYACTSASVGKKGKIMALVQVGFRVRVSLMDGGGQITTRSYESDAALYADAVVVAAALVAALDPLTDATITGYGIETVFAEDALAGFPAATVQNENQALLVYQMEGLPLHRATQSIPAPAIGIFAGVSGPNSNVVDTADADIVAWRTLFQNGNGFFMSDGEYAEVLESGHRRHVRNRFG
jgi:hypothetical protein